MSGCFQALHEAIAQNLVTEKETDRVSKLTKVFKEKTSAFGTVSPKLKIMLLGELYLASWIWKAPHKSPLSFSSESVKHVLHEGIVFQSFL